MSREPHRFEDAALMRVIERCGALGDGASASVHEGVLTLERAWRPKRVAVGLAAAVVAGGVLALWRAIDVAIEEDRLAGALELALFAAMGAPLSILGILAGRRRSVRITRGSGVLELDGVRAPRRELVLVRDGSLEAVRVTLAVREGPTLLSLVGLRPGQAARAKALAVAIAAWTGAPLIEGTPPDVLDALRDADASVGLGEPRGIGERPRATGSAESKLEQAVDVAVLAIRILDSL